MAGSDVAGDLTERTLLVQGAAGSVGICAVQLARRAGAKVIGTVRSSSEEAIANKAGAHDVVLSNEQLIVNVNAIAPNGIDHIVEVGFGANIKAYVELLNMGGSIATYATNVEKPDIPFWQMVFKNIRVFSLGSDDFPTKAKIEAAQDLNSALEAGWTGLRSPNKFHFQRLPGLTKSPNIRCGPGGLLSCHELRVVR